jgi:hypothetical protein
MYTLDLTKEDPMKHTKWPVLATFILALILGAVLLLPQGSAGAQGPEGQGGTDSLDLIDVIDMGPAPDVTADADPQDSPPSGEGDGAVGAASYASSFTYQGRLTDGGQPAEGTYDLRFLLYDAEFGGSQVGGTITQQDVQVSDGLFTVVLDFGSSVYSGGQRYLEIAVRPGDSTGTYTVLSPRRSITPTPYASFAYNADRLDGRDSTSFASSNHEHDDRYYRKRSGTQATTTLSAGQTRTFFTFNWPTDEIVYWIVHPTTTNGRVNWTVDIRLADNGRFIYYFSVTNTGSTTTSVEIKYVIFR